MFWKRKRPTAPPREPLKAGDVLRSPDRRTHAVVIRVEAAGEAFPEPVAHLTQLSYDGSLGGHFPFAPAALASADVVDHWEAPPPSVLEKGWSQEDWEGGYAIWREAAMAGEAGIFTVPIEAVF